ncbi:CBM21 domain-containing protein [Mycena sanguinolenta]|uniref:CBM21 domain-containing protein n=1 Tax=Mycena sanguinolenta TaxID=230812 RepID=A0A8H6XHW3_9AGAR|nr:CBM21 domain-containing protein [Mycena sanguinolenta]
MTFTTYRPTRSSLVFAFFWWFPGLSTFAGPRLALFTGAFAENYNQGRTTMPYSPPGVVAPSLPTPAPSTNAHTRPPPRPGHRRSYTFAADDPRAGPGAFSSLGALPRRTHSHSHAGTPTTPRKFHFGGGDVDDSSSSSDEKEAQLHPLHPSHQPYPHQSQHQRHGAQDDDDYGPPPPLRLRPQAQAPTFRLTPMTGHRASPPRSPQRSPRGSPNSSFTNVPSALSVNTLHVPVPFPRSASSSLSPLSPVPATGTYPTRPPGPSRTASTPIILSNGKPLKSSLKSSKSAPHVPSPGASGLPGSLQGPSGFHLRAQSAPSSPSLGAGAGVAGNWNGSEPSPPMTPKAVHFPAPDAGLEDIRLFKRSARPASVSFPLSLEEETETETETDRDAPRIAIWGGAGERGAGGEWVGDKTSGFPFPKVAPGRSPLRSQTNEKDEKKWRARGDMVRVERVRIEDSTASSTSNAQRSTSPTPELTLHGTLLVRNAAFEKHLFVRFTLDGWATTSEVGARYLDTVNVAGQGEEAGPGWDRFGFSIRLTDYAHSSGATPGHRIAGSLRGIGGSGGNGLGKGLEGRTLVLVARFFAPWVKEGGVGPYVWCDTLPPTAQTPATQAGAGTSPSGRPWIGQGGGGPGEWWDNNGGKNYDVGFRCVDVEEPAPSPPPVPAQVPAPQQNVIPFPTSSTNDTDAPPSQPEAPASPLPTSTPTHPAGAPPAPAENKPIPRRRRRAPRTRRHSLRSWGG